MHPFDRFTPNAKLALQIAEQEAKNMKSTYIGTEHLLLGLLSIPKSLGFSIFTGAGITLENVRIILKAVKSQKSLSFQSSIVSSFVTVRERCPAEKNFDILVNLISKQCYRSIVCYSGIG